MLCTAEWVTTPHYCVAEPDVLYICTSMCGAACMASYEHPKPSHTPHVPNGFICHVSPPADETQHA
eukprot:1146287-Pelagomonas_calceolata.AAC.7